MNRLWKIPMQSPYKITSDAGEHIARTPPEWPLCGIDFISLTNSQIVLAFADGVVEYKHKYNPALAQDGLTDGGYHSLGRFVVIRHYAGAVPVWVRYCHLEIADVESGDTVGAGNVIGLSGNTGLSSAQHLHVDFWVLLDDLKEAQDIGFKKVNRFVQPWPGSIRGMQNLDPTEFLTKCGLDVIRDKTWG